MKNILKLFYPVTFLGVLFLLYKKFKQDDEDFLVKEREQLEKLYAKYGAEAVDIYHRVMGD
jgi:hypothetical protein